MKLFLSYLFVIVILCSCEKTINLSVNKQPAKLVVDAQIENNLPPVVVLSNSLNYFSSITPKQLAASFIHNAKVTISDSAQTADLVEYNYTDTSGYTFYYYTININNPLKVIIGKLNTAYHLKITMPDSSVYTSTTTIPLMRKTCDSLYWQTAPNNPDTNRCVLFGLFHDPKGYGDYVRYFVKVNSQPFYSGLPSAFDDQITDGTNYTFQIPRSYSLSDSIKVTDKDFGFYHRGDTITFKFCDIDKSTFDFWRTWEFAYQSTGNPFSSPAQVLSNISNNALGTFSGYAAQYRSIIIPK